jgi:hypothetical protein
MFAIHFFLFFVAARKGSRRLQSLAPADRADIITKIANSLIRSQVSRLAVSFLLKQLCLKKYDLAF